MQRQMRAAGSRDFFPSEHQMFWKEVSCHKQEERYQEKGHEYKPPLAL
jgi:hypothetical protein